MNTIADVMMARNVGSQYSEASRKIQLSDGGDGLLP